MVAMNLSMTRCADQGFRLKPLKLQWQWMQRHSQQVRVQDLASYDATAFDACAAAKETALRFYGTDRDAGAIG
jgi:hypothetical protein